jgi:hypothetical protein
VTDSRFRAIETREAVRVAALFAVLVAIAFFNIVFLGESFTPGNNANPVAPTYNADNYGPHFRPYSDFQLRAVYPYASIHDVGSSWWQGEPAMELLQRALWRGEFPLWDPYTGGGAPAMANITPAFFFPPSFLVALAGNQPWLKNASALFLVVCAGFFTYVFVRKHNVSLTGSIAAGIAFMFSGAVIQTIPEFLGQPVVGIPLVLAATACLAHRPTWQRAVFAAFAYATTVLASFPPVLVMAVMIAAVYVLVIMIWTRSGDFAVKVAFAGILTASLVAFYYIPILYVIRGADYARRFYQDVGFQKLEPRVLYQLFGPTLMGGEHTYFEPVVHLPDGSIFYFGVTGLLLAVATVGRFRPWPWVVPFQLLVVIWLMKILGVPPVQSLAHLPVFNSMHIASYGGLLLAFPLACMCGVALHLLMERRLHFVAVAISIAGWGYLLLRLWRVSSWDGSRWRPQFWRWAADYRIVLVFFVLAAVLLVASFRFKKGMPAFGIAMIALLSVEGIINASFAREPRWNYWDHPPRYVRELTMDKSLGRLLPFSVLPANTNSPFSIVSTDSLFTFNSTQYTELHHRYFGSAEYVLLGVCTRLPPESVLDAFSVNRIAINQLKVALIAETEKRGYRRVFNDDFVAIFARPSAPRYFLTRDYAVRSPQDAFYAIAQKPALQLLLDRPAGFPPDPAFHGAPVRVEHFGLNSYRLRVTASAPALLSMSETNFPGWTAEINGREVPIRPANYAFRALEVPAGTSVVEMSYWPPGMTAGMIISVLALLVSIAIVLRHRLHGDAHLTLLCSQA